MNQKNTSLSLTYKSQNNEVFSYIQLKFKKLLTTKPPYATIPITLKFDFTET